MSYFITEDVYILFTELCFNQEMAVWLLLLLDGATGLPGWPISGQKP